MARLIGRGLIDNIEVSSKQQQTCFRKFQTNPALTVVSGKDLRLELENLIQIKSDLDKERVKDDGSTIDDSKSTMSRTSKGAWSIFSESKNATFLNQELMFFIENLQQKATESGLNQDALIPRTSKKDAKIYSLLRD